MSSIPTNFVQLVSALALAAVQLLHHPAEHRTRHDPHPLPPNRKVVGLLFLQRPPPRNTGCLVDCKVLHFTPRIASLAAFATRNFTTRLALIWIVSPVAGLQIGRAHV